MKLDILIDGYNQTSTINGELVPYEVKISKFHRFLWQGQSYKVLSIEREGSWYTRAEAEEVNAYNERIKQPKPIIKVDHTAYCKGCLKLKDDGTCIALKELWTEWNPPGTECWSREEDPARLLDMLKQVDRYEGMGTAPQRPNGWRNEVKLLKEQLIEREKVQ